MPPRGTRVKGKPRSNTPKNPTSSSTGSRMRLDEDDGFLSDLDNAKGWNVVVNVLCASFDLPDLTSRNGLKKVHANFEAIYSKMDRVYETNLEDVKIRGGIVGIFAKMCVDSILRNKLFEKGILRKIIPLLNIDETRHLALRALSNITHHGGRSIRTEIAEHCTNIIIKLIRDLPDDERVAELGVATLVHSICAVVDGDKEPDDPRVFKTLDMVDVFKVLLETMKRPYSSPRSIIEHVIELLFVASLHAASAYKAYPPAINFLVAGLRSNDWVCRCTCLNALIRIYRFEGEDDQSGLHPIFFTEAMKTGPPPHLGAIMDAYGRERCDTYLTYACNMQSAKAIMVYAKDRDLYALGLKQGALIVKTEFSIINGTGLYIPNSPFDMWSDSLKFSADAIRQKGKPSEEDLADIVELKFLISKHLISEAVDLAKKALQRDPHQAYFYYAISLSGDYVQGLRAAKKGMKCKITTPFLKHQMMQRAADHAANMGLKLMMGMPEAGEKVWEEGIAFLMSALEDAKAYLEGAPPDNRHMKNMGYWFVLLSILVKPDMSPDLKELDGALKSLKIADQFSEFVGITPPKTTLRLTQQAVVKHYPLAVTEFSHVFAKLDELRDTVAPAMDRNKVEDDLAAWLDDLRLEDGTLEDVIQCGSGLGPKVNADDIDLYRCSWCGNPSAVLRKCARCSKTRYCDAGCQKSHWTNHKKECYLDS
ncbi:hypothetical protein BDZ97DRAFT_1663105 [Flammula alnicola]|nr:hypothetical protein BDZ97DRAFT_1663105 [Flammula alnicola]